MGTHQAKTEKKKTTVGKTNPLRKRDVRLKLKRMVKTPTKLWYILAVLHTGYCFFVFHYIEYDEVVAISHRSLQ